MTPYELNLDHELNRATLDFRNQWLFKWHNINIERHLVDVDRFDGGRIQIGGVRFEGQPQQIYWQAINRYISQKVHGSFNEWDNATRSYPAIQRKNSLDGAENRLKTFAANIIRHSVETDRRLRGKGFPERIISFDASKFQTQAESEISRLAEAHRKLVDEQRPPERKIGIVKKAQKTVEDFYANNKGLIWLTGIVVSSATAAWHLFFK